jgi:hypothetical protein
VPPDTRLRALLDRFSFQLVYCGQMGLVEQEQEINRCPTPKNEKPLRYFSSEQSFFLRRQNFIYFDLRIAN